LEVALVDLLDAALEYAKHGFKVFPCALAKTPITKRGFLDATTDEKTICDWWGQHPDASIGTPTEGLVVLDFDKAHGGMESMLAIEAKFGPLPKTRVHKTGGGGLHCIYSSPNGTIIRNTVEWRGYKGVDIRATGGYIILPPSPHPSGKCYEIASPDPIAPAPLWLISQQPRGKPVHDNEAPIPEGQRNATLASLAGTMRRRGMTPTAIEAALMAENEARCDPPLPAESITKIAKSVSRYQPSPEAPPNLEEPNIPNIPNKANEPNRLNISELSEHEAKTYQYVSRLVEKWLSLHKGETFDLDTICRQLAITNREDRHRVVVRLFHAVESDLLKKSGRLYTYIDKTFKLIEWWKGPEDDHLAIRWPWGHQDNSGFGFAETVSISQGDVIMIAGLSNMGKTAFCLNLLLENMDMYPCTLMGNEYKPSKFRRRIEKMDWVNPMKEDGSPKFELIERYEKWADIIRPDNINIIDWINLGDNFYQIGRILEDIQERLKKGIAVISIQKSEGKALGLGGGFSEHLASLYLVLDFEKLTVRKAKEWANGPNPNGQMYGFEIIDGGSKFHHIREIKPCKACFSTGKSRGQKCGECGGKGTVDA